MKKLSKIGLILLLSLGLTACTNTGKTAEESTVPLSSRMSKAIGDNVPNQSNANNETVPDDSDTPDLKSLPKKKEVLNLEYRYLNISDDFKSTLPTRENVEYYIMVHKPEITSEQYTQINEMLESKNRELLQALTDKVEAGVALLPEGEGMYVSLFVEPLVIRADTSVFSLEYDYSCQFITSDGDVEAISGLSTSKIGHMVNIDVKNRKEISFTDIVKDVDALKDTALTLVDTFYPNDPSKYETPFLYLTKEDVTKMLDENALQQIPFTIGYDSLRMRQDRERGYYVDFALSIPLRAYPDLFHNTYTHVPKSYTTYLDYSEIGYMDLNQDNTEDLFTVDSYDTGTDPDFILLDYRIKTQDGEIPLHLSHEIYSPPSLVTIVRPENGKAFLYISSTENDYDYMFRLDMNASDLSTPPEPDFYDGFVRGYVNPNKLILRGITDIVGTESVYKTVYANAHGDLIPDGQFSDFDTINKLVTKTELPALVVQNNDHPQISDEEIVISAGEALLPLHWDNAETVIFQREDKSLIAIRIHSEHTDEYWGYKVNGIPLEEAFDNVSFSG